MPGTGRTEASLEYACGLLSACVIWGAFRWSFLEAVPPCGLGEGAGCAESGFLPFCSHCRMISFALISDTLSSLRRSMISGGT